jgi:hypothetical protein
MTTNAEVVMLVGLGLVCCFTGCASAGTQEGADCSRAETHLHTSQKTKNVDLGGGISLTEVVAESDNGEVRQRATTITRNGKRVMVTLWNKATKDRARETFARSYWHDGKLVLSEGDEDGNGILDLLILYDDVGMPIEAFDEKKDGTLFPLSKDRVEKIRKEYGFMLETMTPIVQGAKKGVTEQEGRRLIEDAVTRAKKGKDDQTKPSSKEADIPGTQY